MVEMQGTAVPKLRAIESIDEKIRNECIAVAENLLAKAKAGEITGFVVICDCPANQWLYLQTMNQDRIQLLGKIRLCEIRLATALFEDGR